MTREEKKMGKSDAKAVSSQEDAYSTGMAQCASMWRARGRGMILPSCHSRACDTHTKLQRHTSAQADLQID